MSDIATPDAAAPPAAQHRSLDQRVDALLRERQARTAVSLVPEGLEAFAVRAAAARAATRSLDLLYYAWHDDVTGRLLADEVLRAAQRGVQVRLLLDDSYVLGDGCPAVLLAAHPRIEVRLFNASRWSRFGRFGFLLDFATGGWHLNHRMHNKAWIADDRVVVTGGRNIGDEYFDASGEFNFRDLDLVVAGDAVFERYWQHRLTRKLEKVLGRRAAAPVEISGLRDGLQDTRASGDAAPYLERLHANFRDGMLWNDRSEPLSAEDVRIVADPPEKATGRRVRGGLASAIATTVSRAKREVIIVSPYFVPGRRGTRMLLELRRRGVRISVVTNSLAATDVVAVHSGYARYRKRLLKAGVEISELKRSGREDHGVFGSSGASLHSKALSVDGELVFVGSFNLDPRSANLNTEMGAFARHRELARRLAEEHARLADPVRSYRLRLTGAGLCWVDKVNGSERVQHNEPDASLRRRVMALLVRYLPLESQL